jgi:hypothetical protein
MLEPEVLIGFGHSHTAARCTSEEPDSHEEGLHDTLDSLGFLTDGHGESAEPDRSSPEPADERVEHGSIETVQADRIDVVELECSANFGDRSRSVFAVDERVIAHPAQ